jgi:hypothetical protein
LNLEPLRTYASFVRFSHSVFALPFALTGALLGFHARAGQGPVWDGSAGRRLLWIVVAMVAARSAAMGFNRLVDARHDALNPRTSMRELPRGAMTVREATVFVVVASILLRVRSISARAPVLRASPVRWDRVLVLGREALHVLHAALSGARGGGRPVVGGWRQAAAADGSRAARPGHRHLGGGSTCSMPARISPSIARTAAFDPVRFRRRSIAADLRGMHVITVIMPRPSRAGCETLAGSYDAAWPASRCCWSTSSRW